MWKGSSLHPAKIIDPCQPAQSAQADMGRYFLLLENYVPLCAIRTRAPPVCLFGVIRRINSIFSSKELANKWKSAKFQADEFMWNHSI